MNRLNMVSRAALVGAALAVQPGTAFAATAQESAATAPAASTNQQEAQRPNVLVWLLDDVGFAQFSSFGGLIPTPNIDRVAKMGLRYTNYHTAPVCSAARASLLTGRMPHSVNIGGHVVVSRPVRGYTGHIPPSAGTIADNLHQAGYATFAVGKWDHIPNDEATPAGPFRQWPTQQGFERFYGFLSADTDNWHPSLVRDQTPVPRPDRPDYHLNRDLADEAIAMIGTRRIADPARPFLMYWATGTAHAPHHAPKEWIDRFKGKFDMGWDKAREAILKDQKARDIMPANARLAPRPDDMPAWDTLSAEQKKLYTRQMEVFAASLAYADAEFGRILDTLEASGELDNTIVIVTSDNGASAEGNTHGMYTEGLLGRGRKASLEENMAFYDEWGGPGTFPHYSYGWALAGNTPFRYYKHTTFEGGTRVPLVMAWPKGIAARGELRDQFTHVSDITPTVMEAAGIPLAPMVDNVEQQPLEGTSFAYSFAAPDAPTRKQAQYFEMFGNKGLWADGWTIVTSHRLEPWDMATSRPITAPWELYDLSTDIGQSNDLAAKYPERVQALASLFEEQAERYHVNPIGNIGEGTMTMYRQGQEEFARRAGKWAYPGPVGNLSLQLAPPISAMGFRMDARLDLPTTDVTGPIFATGGHLGGMALYLRKGSPVFVINRMNGQSFEIAAETPLAAGERRISLEFARAKEPGDTPVVIRADNRVVAQGVVPAEQIKAFGVFEHFGVGIDGGTPVMAGAKTDVPFPGRISDVVFDFNQSSPAAAEQ